MRTGPNEKPFSYDAALKEAAKHRTLTSLARGLSIKPERLKRQLEKRGKLEEIANILKRWCRD